MAENVPLAPLQSPRELKAQIEAERKGLPFLVYRDGEGQQHIFPLGNEVERVTVGRVSATDICLDWDTEVSRLHADLSRIGRDWTVSDDGLSRNGTYVNGAQVSAPTRIRRGDRVQFGQTVGEVVR